MVLSFINNSTNGAKGRGFESWPFQGINNGRGWAIQRVRQSPHIEKLKCEARDGG